MNTKPAILMIAAWLLLALGSSSCGDEGQQVEPSCDDGLMNGEETDLDCGGPCGTCAAGGGCETDGDCRSELCVEDRCTAPSCSDGIQNGYETDVDCGGNCAGCAVGDDCRVGENCQTGSCRAGVCTEPTCDDGVQNGDELGADCGGGCGPCPAGGGCQDAAGCLSGVCTGGLCQAPTCLDQVQNGLETDDDCGGPDCDPCAAQQSCALDSDCQSLVCSSGEPSGACQEATCDDGVKNGDELGVDCAGSCPPCPGGEPCVLDLDCLSKVCTDGVCEAPTCADLLHNGDETDVDCGGTCPPCSFNENCVTFEDCKSGLCAANGRCAYGESCAHILSASPGAPDGLYQIDPELDGYEPLWAYCDMTTDGGGWTLVLNYLHVGGTNPQLYNSPDRLPWLVSSELGEDEQGTFSWRHTQNALFAKLHIDELRFYGITSAHQRTLHFKTDLPGCIQYFATGTGSCEGIQHHYRALPGHDSNLPDMADGFYADRGNQAMTDFPFYTEDPAGQFFYWGVRGDGLHWTLDHGQTGSGFDTLHRIWVRAAPSHCLDGSPNYSESDTDCGGLCSPCPAGAACSFDRDCRGICQNGACVTLPNCTEILLARPGSPDGEYIIDPDGPGGLSPISVTCDMTTDGGGWTLVLNYLHQGGTDPLPQLLAAGLPVRLSDRLGKSEEGTAHWGHASPELFASLNVRNVRFFAQSAGHDRVVHFSTGSADCIAYLGGDETRSCGDIARGYVALQDHTARLPGEVDGAAQLDQDELVMTSQPFYQNGRTTWNVGFGMWNVDEWHGGSGHDTLHRVWVRSVPRFCADGSQSPGETDVDCGGPCPARCGPDQACLANPDCVTGLCQQGLCAPAQDCAHLLWADPSASSGDYLVDLDGAGGLDPLLVSCDMDTEGGGWMLALNYLHRGGTNPAPVVLADRLPLRGAEVLGPDESGTPRWGHAGNTLFATLDVDEIRFAGRTSGHERRMDFLTSDTDCITYLDTGSGSDCSGVVSNHRTLPGHTAMLPQAMDMFSNDRGDQAMASNPFWMGWHFHWVIEQNRWDVDDNAGDASQHTLHRVWVRAAPDYCTNGQADPEEEGTDCGGLCPVRCAPVGAGEPCSGHHQCVTGVCQTGTCTTVADCMQILANQPGAQNGDYLIDPDGAGGLDPFFASCDMTTNGGGWTLVLNYLHQGGTDPLHDIRTADLPLRGSNIMGTDESGTGFWGHAGNALFALFSASEVRFDAISRGVNRYLHSSTCLPTCLAYFATGTGNCAGLGTHHRLLAGHRANLPATMTSQWSDQGDQAMTFFPFYQSGTSHWSMWRDGTRARWEVDDYPNDASQNTLHRVWVRSCPVMMTEDFQDGDMAGWSVLDETGTNGPSAWSVSAGWLVQTSNMNGGSDETRRGTIAFWDNPTALAWQDYRFAVTARNDDNDGIGVVFRYQDAGNFYRLDLDVQWSQWSRLSVMRNGVETTIAQESGPGFTEDQNFPLEVEVRGDAITVYKDGRPMFGGTLYDDSLDHGTVGFYCWGSEGAYFDNVAVLQPCP